MKKQRKAREYWFNIYKDGSFGSPHKSLAKANKHTFPDETPVEVIHLIEVLPKRKSK